MRDHAHINCPTTGSAPAAEPQHQAADSGWSRRRFGAAMAMLAACMAMPAMAQQSMTAPDAAEAPDAARRALFRAVAQLVIPRTATPGAGDAGVGDFVLLALARGLDGSRRPLPAAAREGQGGFLRADGSLRHADWLAAELDRRAGGRFMARGVNRAALLAGLDGESFAPGAGVRPWRLIKGLIITGYYSSEAGASQELAYEPVPGRWDPDLPLTAATRTIANDWISVEFG